jgi:putative PIN family toxin of toxin-antitoxin system
MRKSNKPFNEYGNEKEQKVKCVIDTNILIAALLNRTGAPAKIMERFRNAEFELATSESIVREYREVILEFENDIPDDESIPLLELIEVRSAKYEVTVTLSVCRDTGDNKFLECAISSGADFLATKNLRHYPIKEYQGVKIVTVGQFLTVLEERER